MSNWLPIKRAQKSMIHIIVGAWVNRIWRVSDAFWSDHSNRWISPSGWEATHYMPLPTPPDPTP